MTEDRDNLLRQVAEDVPRAVSAQRVIVFGSYAAGLPGPDSDLDILVIEDEPFGPGRSRREEIHRVRTSLRHLRIPKDILVFSADEVEYWRESPSHITSVALREGTVVYERS